jgi:hypothetical protein
MNPWLETGALAGFEDGRRFLRRKDTGLTKHVAPLGEASGLRNHLVDHQPHVIRLAAAEFDRHFVRAHERGDEFHRLRGIQSLDHAENA